MPVQVGWNRGLERFGFWGLGWLALSPPNLGGKGRSLIWNQLNFLNFRSDSLVSLPKKTPLLGQAFPTVKPKTAEPKKEPEDSHMSPLFSVGPPHGTNQAGQLRFGSGLPLEHCGSLTRGPLDVLVVLVCRCVF